MNTKTRKPRFDERTNRAAQSNPAALFFWSGRGRVRAMIRTALAGASLLLAAAPVVAQSQQEAMA